ncbi:MAG: hypothetical protein ABI462_13210, partial [Ignavibacteria bacterium]
AQYLHDDCPWCCFIENCIKLPICSCAEVLHDSVYCVNGDYFYDFKLQNGTQYNVTKIQLTSPDAPITFVPQIFPFSSSIPPGGMFPAKTAQILGGAAGMPFTIRIKLFSGNFECCYLELNHTLPSCDTAQSCDNKGTNFWLMFNGNAGTPQTLTLNIVSETNTSGNVIYDGVTYPFVVSPGVASEVMIPASASVHTSDVIDDKGIHVTSQNEVTVYGLNFSMFSTGGYLGLPTEMFGTDYFVLSYKNNIALSGSQFGIVACENNTFLTITPSATTGTRTAGIPYNIILNAGETYELTNYDFNSDLTGTHITASHPIAVFGSAQTAKITNSTDHIVEMLPPTSAYGKHFFTVPLTAMTGDTWRFMGSQNGTTITINPGGSTAMVDAGQFIEIPLPVQSEILSDKPILACQYQIFNPFMMLLPSVNQFLKDYTVFTPGIDFTFIDIVAPDAVVNSLTLDGGTVSFTAIGNGYSGASVSVVPGTHKLTAALPFGCNTYGFSRYSSYGYPGGMSCAVLNNPFSLNLNTFIQGRYNDVTNLMAADTIEVDIRNSIAPYWLVETSRGYLNDSGKCSAKFYNAVDGVDYYVVLKHRNSVETWSKSPGQRFSGGVLNFDFLSSSQSYGNNLGLIDSSPLRYGLFSGDVNQDGVINLTDILWILNDSQNFESGVSDLNGDGVTNLTDLTIAYNNAINFGRMIRP